MKYFNRLEEYIMLVTFPAMLLVILVATFSRFFSLFSLSWGEEAARYLMIWLGFAGISYGFKKNAHLGVSFIVEKFPPRMQKLLALLRTGLILFFGLFLAYFSYDIIGNQFRFHQISPSLHIPMWTIYSAMLAGGILILVRTVQSAFLTAESLQHAEKQQWEGQ